MFSQSHHTYCRIPAGDFKYQGRQGFQRNKNFIKRRDIKQANISENDIGFRTQGCECVASRLFQQISKYMSWQPDPHPWMVGAFQISWTHLEAYNFQLFTHIVRVLAKAMIDKCTLIIITPVWPSQPWYNYLFRMSMEDPIFSPPFPNFLTDPNQNRHPFCQNQTLVLAAISLRLSIRLIRRNN